MEGENNKINNMIEKLIDKNTESSFAVCDLNDIVRRYQSWILAMPKIKPFYAIKSNNYPRILQLFADLGVGFECATQYEIEAALKTNCPPDKIIYASTIKNTNHISYANSVGVSLTTFDSLSELEKCKKNYENARLMIRIKTYSKNESNFEEKFGCDPYNEAPILLEAAKSLGLNVIGVSFHVGTICDDGPTYCTAIKLARHVFDIADELGFKFDVLDIGGGFIPHTENTIFEIGKCINNALDTYFPSKDMKFMAEPGRYFVRSSVTVATRVIGVKPNRLNCNENELKYAYYVDNGICNMFQTVNHGFPVSPPLAWKKTTPFYPSTVFGPTAVHCDTICPDVILPKLDVGDWLIFHNMGAYTQCLETIFHFCRPIPVYFIDTSDTLFSKNKTTFCDEFLSN